MKENVGNTYASLEASLKDIPPQLGGVRPTAVLRVHGHVQFTTAHDPAVGTIKTRSQASPRRSMRLRVGVVR